MDDLNDPGMGDDSSSVPSDSSPPLDQSPPPVDSSPPSPPTDNTPPDDSPPSPDSTAPSNDSPPPVTPSPNGSLPVPIFSPPSPISSEAPRSEEREHSRSRSKSSSKDSKHSSESDSKKSDSGSSDSSSSSLDAGVIAGLAAAAVLLLAVIVLCICCKRRKNKKKQIYYMDPQHPYKGENMYYNNGPPSQWHGGPNMDHVVKLSQQPPSGAMMPGNGGWGAPPPPPNSTSPQMGGFNQSQFSYEMLAAATNGFSQENLLGQGGFGYVHKGVLPSGKVVAIKSLKSGSGQGEREFQAEVEIISRVHHRYLVSLVGYCISERQRMLVYEYVSNKTLEFHLHGKGQPVMDWATRLKIALGSAKGLAYLHEDCHPRIIHRDIKAANILLDDNFEAMVADFGLAKLSTDNNTHVSTRVMGTFGYLAPEYASSGKLTEKSDVFSFGVMLLELITGHQPVDLTGEMEDSLVEWARPLLASAIQDGIYDELVDKRLEGNYHPDEMARMVSCAAASVRHSARRRPKMSQIVRALEGNSSLEDLNETGKALQSGVSSMSTSSMSGMTSSGDSHMYDTCAYNADIMKFRKMVLSEDSSEFGTTGEFGTNRSSTSS